VPSNGTGDGPERIGLASRRPLQGALAQAMGRYQSRASARLAFRA
jgi:hypothetical protein